MLYYMLVIYSSLQHFLNGLAGLAQDFIKMFRPLAWAVACYDRRDETLRSCCPSLAAAVPLTTLRGGRCAVRLVCNHDLPPSANGEPRMPCFCRRETCSFGLVRAWKTERMKCDEGLLSRSG